MNILVILKEFLPATFANGKEETFRLCDTDRQVLTEALHLRDAVSGQVTVLAHGSMDGADILMDIWSYAPDRVVMLPNPENTSFDAANMLVRAKAIASAVRQLGEFSLILFGRQASDGDSIHIAALVSHFLGFPLVTYTQQLQFLSGEEFLASCVDDYSVYTVRATFPAVVLSIRDKQTPRYPRIADIRKAYGGKCITEYLSFSGQNTVDPAATSYSFLLLEEYPPETDRAAETVFLSGNNNEEKAEKLFQLLRAKGYTAR